ncbi:MAG: hypothetical protein ABIG42_09930 [bacterium]
MINKYIEPVCGYLLPSSIHPQMRKSEISQRYLFVSFNTLYSLMQDIKYSGSSNALGWIDYGCNAVV